MTNQTTDFLIIGGGVVGLNLALQAKARHPDCRVMVIEKEKECGLHASGRNSGVLHAGFYYTADSLKARFTRDGNRALTEYCLDKKIALNRCGKLVVAKNADEAERLSVLMARAKANQVELLEISEAEAKEIEPRVKTHEKALFSPSTSSVDPTEVMRSFMRDAKNVGVDILFNTAFAAYDGGKVRTTNGAISAGYIINAAGLYADKIAKDFGFSKDYCILPFKGLYLYADNEPSPIRTNIYPVPDLNNPFLGVHYTITADAKVKIGPTAIPAFWREHYSGWANFSSEEFFEIVGREISLFMRNQFGFRHLAIEELKKYSKAHMAEMAGVLASDVHKENYTRWARPGIRAQLVNTKEQKLEMDFHFEGDKNSFHVLNAVSPAFTCAMVFSQYLMDEIECLLESGAPKQK